MGVIQLQRRTLWPYAMIYSDRQQISANWASWKRKWHVLKETRTGSTWQKYIKNFMSLSFQLPSIEPPIILFTQGYLTDKHLNCDLIITCLLPKWRGFFWGQSEMKRSCIHFRLIQKSWLQNPDIILFFLSCLVIATKVVDLKLFSLTKFISKHSVFIAA